MGAEDDHGEIDVGVLVLDGVDDVAQLLGGACGEEVDGVAHRGAAEEFLEQCGAGGVLLKAGHLDAVVAEHVGEHDGGAAGMGDDGAAVALDLGIHEHTADGGQFLTVLAAYDARFAEQGVDSSVVGGQSTRVATGGAAACCAATALDGGNMATFVDEAAAVFEQTLGVAHLFHIQHDDVARLLGVEGLVEMFQHILNTQLGAVAHSPHAVELKTVGHAVFLYEHGGGT